MFVDLDNLFIQVSDLIEICGYTEKKKYVVRIEYWKDFDKYNMIRKFTAKQDAVNYYKKITKIILQAQEQEENKNRKKKSSKSTSTISIHSGDLSYDNSMPPAWEGGG